MHPQPVSRISRGDVSPRGVSHPVASPRSPRENMFSIPSDGKALLVVALVEQMMQGNDIVRTKN